MSRPLAVWWAPAGAVLLVAACWVFLFALNDWLFAFSSLSIHVNWIFLPAALRMLAVLWLGWRGVLGLFLGNMVTNLPHWDEHFGHALMLSLLSSVSPWLAARATQRIARLPDGLQGIGPGHLLQLGVNGALASAAAHQFYFALRGQGSSPLSGLLPMFVGDVVGTCAFLYLAALALRFFQPRQPSA